MLKPLFRDKLSLITNKNLHLLLGTPISSALRVSFVALHLEKPILGGHVIVVSDKG